MAEGPKEGFEEALLPSLALYIHWPFCLSKCPYCDFNSHVRRKVDEKRFISALQQELQHRHSQAPERRISSIFFGGGTPSLMAPESLAKLLETIRQHWLTLPDIEITLEANPTSVEQEKFQAYREVGINRLSLGIQSFDPQALGKLGRTHNVKEALRALEITANIFPRYSFDLIYARPEQNEGAWGEELNFALSFSPDHISLYQLTIEPGTPFERLHQDGKLILPNDLISRNLWDLTQDMTTAHGLPAYEISNHARPGEASRHNLNYWRYGEYIGIGPGAHGRLLQGNSKRDPQRYAQVTESHPEKWLVQVEQQGHGLIEHHSLSCQEQADELLVMGLRLKEGIDLRKFEVMRGRNVAPETLEFLSDQGFIQQNGSRLQLTSLGFPVLNAILAALAN